MQHTLPSLTTTMQVLPEPTEQTDSFIITTDLDSITNDDDDDDTTDLPILITEDDQFIYATISDTTEDTTDAITIHLCRSTTETISAAFTLDDSSSVNRPPATDSLITATARCCCRHEILSSLLGLPIHYFIFGGLTIVFIIIIVASSPSLYSYLL